MRRTVLRPRKLEIGTHRVPVSNARRSKDTNTAPTMVMYGDWIAPNNAGVPVDAIKKLNTGEDVYMRVDSPYIKMVATSGVAKYFVGPNVNLFRPANI